MSAVASFMPRSREMSETDDGSSSGSTANCRAGEVLSDAREASSAIVRAQAASEAL